MNFGKTCPPTAQRGNAMVYILLGLALLALLTATLMRQSDQESDDLSHEEAEILATQVIAYAASAQNAIDQMIMSGSDPGTLTFTLPSDTTAFNTAPHINKVFHPQGGGLNYKVADSKMFTGNLTPPTGWYLVRANNAVWTKTNAHDVILSARGIRPEICAVINKRLTGSTSIPTSSSNMAGQFGIGTSPIELTNTTCPACENKPSLCVGSSDGTVHNYYTIIVGR